MKIMMKITAKLIILKGQSYARIPSISHLLIIFVKTNKITTFVYTMIMQIRNKPQGFCHLLILIVKSTRFDC